MTLEKLIRYGKDYLHDLETACCPISDIHKEFVREAIKALEIVEEFEKAQIITGGRLNGRTYAYKCGLEDGKRKALEQQPIEDCVSRAEVLKQMKEWRDCEFVRMTNPYHYLEKRIQSMPPVTPTLPSSEDCVSRQATLDAIIKELCIKDENYLLQSEKAIYNVVKNMPSVTPKHGTCKDCKHNYKTSRNTFECSNGHRFYMRIPDTFYCADYEKRGNEE